MIQYAHCAKAAAPSPWPAALGIHACSGAFLDDALTAWAAAGHRRDSAPVKARITGLKTAEHPTYHDTNLSVRPIKPQLISRLIEEVFEEDAIYAVGSG